MKKQLVFVSLALLGFLANATELPKKMGLDKVIFQASSKQWVTTQTALLTVNINATLSNADLVKARAEIMSNLNKIAQGEWHLTQFDRSQDSSGLEKLFVAAQARVPQGNLKDIYQNAKDVTKPGATYQINEVDFKPSLEETQQVKAQLRETLYQQINAELANLNKTYPNQKYSAHKILFYEGEQALPMAKSTERREVNTMLMASASVPLTVSNELIMSAIVELASTRQEITPVANH